MGGEAAREGNEASQPVEPRLGEGLDGAEVVGPRDDGAERERKEVPEGVSLAVVSAWIKDEVEVTSEEGHEQRGGRKPLLRRSE